MPTTLATHPNKTSTHWLEVETVHHNSSGKIVRIVIIQNQSTNLYSAIASEKQGKRWIVMKEIVVSPCKNWSEVLDKVVAKISADRKHHSNKLWEVRR